MLVVADSIDATISLNHRGGELTGLSGLKYTVYAPPVGTGSAGVCGPNWPSTKRRRKTARYAATTG